MATKSSKTSARVAINTGLLILMAIVFGIMTFCGVSKLDASRKNLVGISDAPALCYDEELYKKNDGTVIQDTYPCVMNGTEEATSQKDHTMFLYDKINFSATINSQQNDILLITIGSMFTIVSFIGGIVYWNHNRK